MIAKLFNNFKGVLVLLMLIAFGALTAIGATSSVAVRDAVYTFGSSSTPSGWTVSSSNTHTNNYLNFSSGDYVEMATASIFPSGHMLFSDNIKVEVSCGTLNTWSIA